MATTTALGWPTPDPTDPIADGAADMGTLAQAIEDSLPVHGQTRNTTQHVHSTATRNPSGTLSIPSSWNTYDVHLVGAFKCRSTSATRRLLTITPTIEGSGATGQELVHTVEDAALNGNTDWAVPIVGHFTDRTATGSVAFGATIALNAADGGVTTDDVVIQAVAYRTS